MVTTEEAIRTMKEDYDASNASMSVMDEIWQLIIAERQRQTIKWGKQTHADGIWLLILTEELGEASEALLAENHLSGVEELIQAIAVIIAWIEDILKKAEMMKGETDDNDAQQAIDNPYRWRGCSARTGMFGLQRDQ